MKQENTWLAVRATKLKYHRHIHVLLLLGLFLVSLIVFLQTLSPTVYGLDSAELATGAHILGIVHAPGYPLYLLFAHLFTLLPIGDVAFRVNLFSAFCLALTAPVLYSLLYKLIRIPWIAAATTLTCVWSYYLWDNATKAEIYTPQVLTIALCGWGLAVMYKEYQQQGRVSTQASLGTGALFGIALAMAPSSIFFAPGLAVAFLMMRVPFRVSLMAGALGAAIVCCVLLYFPLRGSASLEFNKIGSYDAQGVFHNFDYYSPQGILKAVSAEQFRYLFFINGYLPTFDQLSVTFSWLWRNYLGIGVILGVIGGLYLARHRRGVLAAWIALTLPYTYFYLCYGALDRETMFGPTYLAWAVLLAFGLKSVWSYLPNLIRYSFAFGLPVAALITNFPAVNLSYDTSVRSHAEAVLASLPPNAVVAGYWADITPLQYLQFVEKQRPDVKIYDLFMFEPETFDMYVESLSKTGKRPIVLTGSAITQIPDISYHVTPILISSDENSRSSLPILVGFRLSKPNGKVG